jgi:hypothetical protein
MFLLRCARLAVSMMAQAGQTASCPAKETAAEAWMGKGRSTGVDPDPSASETTRAKEQNMTSACVRFVSITSWAGDRLRRQTSFRSVATWEEMAAAEWPSTALLGCGLLSRGHWSSDRERSAHLDN